MKRFASLPHLGRACLLAGLTLGFAPGCFIFGSGATSSYVQTGPRRPPLPDDTPIRVFLTGPPAQRYEELGVVEVFGEQLAKRVGRAQREARQRGGNGVMWLSSWTRVDESSSTETVETKDGDGKVVGQASVPITSTTSTSAQLFVVLRLLGPPAR